MAQFDSYDDVTVLADADSFLVDSDADAKLVNISWGDLKALLEATSLYELSHNLIKNYPSLEGASGVEPEWWYSNNATLIETAAASQGISNPPNERLLKVVTSAANGSLRQAFTITDENLLNVNGVVSAGVYVYSSTAGTVKLFLWDATNGVQIAESTTTSISSWVHLSIDDTAIPATCASMLFIVQHSVSSATFYAANPVLNTGPTVAPFKPRGLKYKKSFTVNVLSTDPATANVWTDLDFTASTSGITAAVDISVRISAATGILTGSVFIRPNGASVGATSASLVTSTTGGTSLNSIVANFMLLDDSQILEWQVNNANIDSLVISTRGYWEWE